MQPAIILRKTNQERAIVSLVLCTGAPLRSPHWTEETQNWVSLTQQTRPGTPGTPTPNTRSPAQWHDGASGTHARLPLIRRQKRIQRFSRCSTRLNVYCVDKRVLIRVWVPAGGGSLACRAGSAAYSARAVLHLQISVAKYGPGHTWTHMDTPRGQAGVLMSPLVTLFPAASE